MRDLETIEAALITAETGHLTFATLHTNSCVETINRIIDVFPPYQQQQIRTQLSFSLEGVLAQQLIPRASGTGRALSMEIMIPNAAIRNLIREDKIQQIYSLMQVGQAKFGMQTMNQALLSLYERHLITLEDALERSLNQDEFRQMLATSNAGRPGKDKKASA
jgi:twitching motility protein PilT